MPPTRDDPRVKALSAKPLRQGSGQAAAVKDQSSPSQPSDEEVRQAASEAIRKASEELRSHPVPSTTEPAMVFRP